MPDESRDLRGLVVAILIADGFEQSEMELPRAALERAGASMKVISLNRGHVQGWIGSRKGMAYPVDLTVEEARPADFDALILAGGEGSIERLRESPGAVRFVREFFELHKPRAVPTGPGRVQAVIGSLDPVCRTVSGSP
jgi:protease I